MDILSQDVKYLKGVGPARAKLLLDELQVATVRDLLYVLPYKYIDRSVIHTVNQLVDDMPHVQLRGKLLDIETEGEGRKRRLKAVFTDGTGYLDLVWFHGIKAMENSLKVNQIYLILGKPSSFNGRMSIAHPEMEKAEDAQLTARTMQPHYHTTEKMKRSGFSSRVISDLVHNAFDRLTEGIPETLPDYLIRAHQLMPLGEALRIVHQPPSADALPPALHRLKFEELFYLQLEILRYSQNRKLNQTGFVFSTIGNSFLQFYNEHLPFELTGAQKRVIKEIRRDMGIGRQMNRLLQGDVGSGKTMVALMCCLIAVDNGYQACLMAPTEILAEQHLATIRNFLGNMSVRVELLTGNVTGKARREILEATVNGEVDILVGTHALIEPNVLFQNLGLAVIDEQHRFGVKQRARLWEKNVRPPHVLVMTATPIPRTLAMTVYGDLDVSVIDELPPGRKPIQTLHYFSTDRGRLYDGINHQLRIGRQVYIVYPLITESETMDLKNLEEGFVQIQEAFPQYKVGKVHGKMKPAEKEEAMRAFSQNETQILVSTTVIEVGVNVPNASVMVIEESQRFGLSQLHQLRGRVGRGADQSYCILVTPRKLSETTRRRMQIMVDSTDGFEIAEEDLKLRGPGDLEGTAQSGMPFQLKVAHLVKDAQLMQQARDVAAEILRQDPGEQLPQNSILWYQLRVLKKQQTNFSAIS